MGTLAVQTLMNCINNKITIPIRTNMPFKLIERESCGKWDEEAWQSGKNK
jgi:DNA-binding LacI/PurR family transcriptional regulator